MCVIVSVRLTRKLSRKPGFPAVNLAAMCVFCSQSTVQALSTLLVTPVYRACVKRALRRTLNAVAPLDSEVASAP